MNHTTTTNYPDWIRREIDILGFQGNVIEMWDETYTPNGIIYSFDLIRVLSAKNATLLPPDTATEDPN